MGGIALLGGNVERVLGSVILSSVFSHVLCHSILFLALVFPSHVSVFMFIQS